MAHPTLCPPRQVRSSFQVAGMALQVREAVGHHTRMVVLPVITAAAVEENATANLNLVVFSLARYLWHPGQTSHHAAKAPQEA